MTDQEFQQYYPGWNRIAAEADWNAVGKSKYGGMDSSGGDSVDSILSSSIQAITGKLQAVKPYEEVDPFAFDAKLAEESVTAEYSPYYAELLSDYTTNIEKQKSRSSEDLDKTLAQLNASKEYYTGVQRRALDKSIRNTNEGYAGKGLFFSGVRGRDVDELKNEFAKGYGPEGYYTKNYANQAQTAITSNERFQKDRDLALSQYTRDTEREKTYAIAAGVQQRKQTALEDWNLKRQQYYDTYKGGLKYA